MSFLPMTEALQRLESDGLVESRPRVGTRVRIPSPQDIREHYIVREALETMSARLFCEKASAAERKELRAAAKQLDERFNRSLSDQTDPESRFEIHTQHFRFHMRIAECTGCVALRDAIEKTQVLIFNWLYDMAAQRSTLPRPFHRDLAAALCGHDPMKADAAMRQHIRYGLEGVLRGIQALPNNDWRAPRKNLMSA